MLWMVWVPQYIIAMTVGRINDQDDQDNDEKTAWYMQQICCVFQGMYAKFEHAQWYWIFQFTVRILMRTSSGLNENLPADKTSVSLNGVCWPENCGCSLIARLLCGRGEYPKHASSDTEFSIFMACSVWSNKCLGRLIEFENRHAILWVHVPHTIICNMQ